MRESNAAAMERLLCDSWKIPTIKDMTPPDAATFGRIKEGFSRLTATYNGRKYLSGDTVTYADLIVAAYLMAFTRGLKDDETLHFRTWDDGKWAQILDECKDLGFLAEDEGIIYDL
jgi:glutathione S-transferase